MRGPHIHSTIKSRLGYNISDSDEDVYADWRERIGRVCKPCWELKYCPYGPLVEQSPLLPPLRSSMEDQQNYLKNCLDTNMVGEVVQLTEESRAMYASWAADENLLRHQALNDIRRRRRFENLALECAEEQIAAWAGGDLPPIHVSRVRFDLGIGRDLQEVEFDPEIWIEILEISEKLRLKYLKALDVNEVDNREILDPVRRVWFQKQIDDFRSDEYPEIIPQTFLEGECSVFGHICPVFFAAEVATETEEARRIGRRNLRFAKMMRIVRRDDYRCQHCHKKLHDNEVEFDHIIPVSKGGSSEEHNIRLTCFDCNRDKSDDYIQ